ncbi:hypothetical protein Tco_0163522 [Tanacetum coccineum]
MDNTPRETVGSQVVQQTGIQCFNSRNLVISLRNAGNQKGDTDEEIDEQELEALYSYMAKIQEVPTADSETDTEPLEQNDSNVTLDSPDMCDNDIQTDQNAEDKRTALANLIANLKLDVDENKKIQKQLKKANASLAHELKESKSILAETSRTLGESNSIRDSCLIALQNKQTEFKRLVPDREESPTLEKESRSKLNKDLVRHYDYTKLNSLYVIFKPASQEYHEQLAHANEEKHSHNYFRAPTALDMEVLIKTCLMPLAIKTQNDSFTFVHELKQEMHADLKYVESLENEIDELESDKAEFSNMYDILLQECVSNDVMCSYLHSLSDLDAHSELQCLYLHKVKECECLAQKLSKQTESVSKEVYTELLRSFAKLEKHSISLELALKQCQEQMKNDTVCKEKASNLKKLIKKYKGKSVETKFDKPSVVRQPNAQRIPKPSVLGKPAPFLLS